jgi:hypothetical protein
MSASASYKFVTVSEMIIKHDKITFQVDTTNGYDGQDVCDLSKPLNFFIDMSQPSGQALFETIRDARKDKTNVGINGDGVCQGDEFENLDTIAPALPI